MSLCVRVMQRHPLRESLRHLPSFGQRPYQKTQTVGDVQTRIHIVLLYSIRPLFVENCTCTQSRGRAMVSHHWQKQHNTYKGVQLKIVSEYIKTSSLGFCYLIDFNLINRTIHTIYRTLPFSFA